MLMEQHFGSVRLFGKKSVAVILGILSIFSFSSAMAEKLDTTFVLDMVIDTTPCYYTKYNRAGQITDLGLYDGKEDFSRINVGYVTDQSGKAVDTLYYVCDRVTKQWREKEITKRWDGRPYEITFYENGMLNIIDNDQRGETYEEVICQYSSDGFVVKDSYEKKTYYPERCTCEKETLYDNYGNITEYTYDDGCYHVGGSAWFISSIYKTQVYTNSYENGNLVSCKIITGDEEAYNPDGYEGTTTTTTRESIQTEQYFYDSLNRRIKSEKYDENGILTDSTVYTYGHGHMKEEAKDGAPYILSLRHGGIPKYEFSYDKFEYDFSDFLIYDNLDWTYTTPQGTSVEKSYDKTTCVLTLTVKGKETTNIYKIKFAKMESYLNYITFDGVPFDAFSYDKFKYDFNDSSMNWSWNMSYGVSLGARTEMSYDTLTGIFKIVVYGADYYENPSNIHTYSFICERPESYLTSLCVNGKSVSDFSFDNFRYDFSDSIGNANFLKNLRVSYTASKGAVVTETIIWNQLILIVKDRQRITSHSYTIDLGGEGLWLTSLDIGGNSVEGFSPNINSYDFSDSLDYDPSVVSYTVFNGIEVNGHFFSIENEYCASFLTSSSFDDKTGILKIEMYYIRKIPGTSSSDSHSNFYYVKFKVPKPQSFMYINDNGRNTITIDTFSSDKFQYDLSDYYLSKITDGEYVHYLEMNKQDTTSDNYFIFRWNISKYATDTVSYDVETGIVTITVKGEDYETDSSNIHEYQILTKKIDSLSIFQIDWGYYMNNQNDYQCVEINVEGDNRVYDMFVAQPAGSWSIGYKSVISNLLRETDFSDLTHTLTLVFSHYESAALTDTFYLNFHPFVKLTSIDDKDGKTHSFATDKFEYESDWKYDPCLVKYDVPDDVTVTRSYDESTGVLTLTARFANDTTQKTEYRIRYAIRQMQSPYINSLFAEEMSVDTFASDKYEYEFEREYEPGLVKYGFSDGIAVTESYDDSTSILTLTVYYDSDTTQKTEYKIHFRPTNGVDDFGGDNVRLYVVDRTICVDGLQSSLSVYDMMGRLVGTGSGESVRVPVQSGGVYVVTSEGNSVKVVVE